MAAIITITSKDTSILSQSGDSSISLGNLSFENISDVKYEEGVCTFSYDGGSVVWNVPEKPTALFPEKDPIVISKSVLCYADKGGDMHEFEDNSYKIIKVYNDKDGYMRFVIQHKDNNEKIYDLSRSFLHDRYMIYKGVSHTCVYIHSQKEILYDGPEYVAILDTYNHAYIYNRKSYDDYVKNRTSNDSLKYKYDEDTGMIYFWNFADVNKSMIISASTICFIQPMYESNNLRLVDYEWGDIDIENISKSVVDRLVQDITNYVSEELSGTDYFHCKTEGTNRHAFFVKDKNIFFTKTVNDSLRICAKDHDLITITDTLGKFAEVIEFFSSSS